MFQALQACFHVDTELSRIFFHRRCNFFIVTPSILTLRLPARTVYGRRTDKKEFFNAVEYL